MLQLLLLLLLALLPLLVLPLLAPPLLVLPLLVLPLLLAAIVELTSYPFVSSCSQLTFSEFLDLLPETIRQSVPQSELRQTFDDVDVNKSGDITMDEYFLWTLSTSTGDDTSALEQIFKKYDKSGEGTLDAAEFARVVEDMGFGSIGHDIFLELDADEGGSISYHEIIKMIKDRSVGVGRECKRLLTAIAFDGSAGTGVHLDTTEWVLDAKSSEQLRSQLQAYLLDQSAKVSDLYDLMTDHEARTLTRPTFLMALYEMGFEGDPNMVKDVFEQFDLDNSGTLGLDELYSWMNGKQQRVLLAKQLTFSMRRSDARPLNEIPWKTEGIRLELQRLLIHHNLCPLDLLRAWAEQDFSLRKTEVRADVASASYEPLLTGVCVWSLAVPQNDEDDRQRRVRVGEGARQDRKRDLPQRRRP